MLEVPRLALEQFTSQKQRMHCASNLQQLRQQIVKQQIPSLYLTKGSHCKMSQAARPASTASGVKKPSSFQAWIFLCGSAPASLAVPVSLSLPVRKVQCCKASISSHRHFLLLKNPLSGSASATRCWTLRGHTSKILSGLFYFSVCFT